jgi:hypothetical protein
MEVPARDRNPFRAAHRLSDKTVIMYSGNHSPANPLRTLLDAAVRFKDDDAVRFLFVGGGLVKKDVEATIRDHGLTNVVSLPYQPLDALGNSLGAADVHVVSLGDNMVGIIHPCKVYGAMAVGRPILFLGPRPSHVSDLLDAHPIGWQVSHGDVDQTVRTIETIRRTPAPALAEMGQIARRVLHAEMGQAILCRRICDHLERVFHPHAGKAPADAGDASGKPVAPADERNVSCAP